MRLRFGDCVFDGDTREVFRGERPVTISPKAFSLLELLVASRPGAVSKTEIHDGNSDRTRRELHNVRPPGGGDGGGGDGRRRRSKPRPGRAFDPPSPRWYRAAVLCTGGAP